MIKVILNHQDNTVYYDETPCKFIYVKDEDEFWKRYNSMNEYIRCNDEPGYKGVFSVYLKKDKIIDIWIENTIEVEE